MTRTRNRRSQHVLLAASALAVGGLVLVAYGLIGGTQPVQAQTHASQQSSVARASTRRRAPFIVIPALQVEGTIGRSTVRNGVLIPPANTSEVGLWPGSASLSDPSGEVTIVGHVHWTGMGDFLFRRLAQMHVGDTILTDDGLGRQTTWQVSKVLLRSKRLPVDPAAFAGPRGPRSLVLITCGGPYDAATASYPDNVYVYAEPVIQPRQP